MKTRLQKQGDTLTLPIPNSIAQKAHLGADDSVELSFEEGRIVVQPLGIPALNLDNLLAQVNVENIHREIETGPAMGNEVW